MDGRLCEDFFPSTFMVIRCENTEWTLTRTSCVHKLNVHPPPPTSSLFLGTKRKTTRINVKIKVDTVFVVQLPTTPSYPFRPKCSGVVLGQVSLILFFD